MKYIIERTEYKPAISTKDILSKLSKKMYGYYSDIIVEKLESNTMLRGKLYRSLTGEAIRFNYNISDKSYTDLISIDLWDNFEATPKFNKPSKTIKSKETDELVSYINNFLKSVNEDINVNNSENESSELESIRNIKDIEMFKKIELDIFDIITKKTLQVAYNNAKSVLITGMSGLGKTYHVEEPLKEHRINHKMISGGINVPDLYETLFLNHDNLIVFDDCDDVFDDKSGRNILKSALDSKDVREVSRRIKTHFETDGMTMGDILANYRGDVSLSDNPILFNEKNKGKLPKSFYFTGRIIFISNMDVNEIEEAILTRTSAHIDVTLTKEEILDRMRHVCDRIHPGISDKYKEETFELIYYLSSRFKTKNNLSIRGFINAIETRIANDGLTTNINGKKYYVWELLIKDDMLGRSKDIEETD